MPLVATRGAASAQGFGEFARVTPPIYIEDVFSTYLYTGNGSTQTINNGIDLAGKGGMSWFKKRNGATVGAIFDTARGNNYLMPSETDGNTSSSAWTAGSTGFTLSSGGGSWNGASDTYASWTFRKQAKFFDIQTFSGGRPDPTVPLPHDLASVPGTIIVKRTDNTGPWYVYHRSLGATKYLVLNTTAAQATGSALWNDTNPTSTTFVAASAVNALGATYVAYLFAHNAGGFGATGTDNVISCGSYTGNGSTTGPVVTLGYEPQWVMIKNTGGSLGDWNMADNMRGMAVNNTTTFNTQRLMANLSNAESQTGWISPTATGFQIIGGNAAASAYNASGETYIYIAIRRGPMKTPTSGTSVFGLSARSGTGSAASITGISFPPDLDITQARTGTLSGSGVIDRLRGTTQMLSTSSTASEADFGSPNALSITSFNMNGLSFGTDTQFARFNQSGSTYANWIFGRAPGFFDVVCYRGTGSALTQAHNLGVTPELMIVKWRAGATGDNWNVYHSAIGATGALYLNKTDPTVGTAWNNTAPTATQFTVGTQGSVNAATYVAYLFATVAGVSKVGSYTGTGALQTVNCGFTSGARFVLIKRTDTTGDWWVYDSARGISSGNDPYLFLNSTAAEVTNTNYVDTASTGFQVTAAAPAGLNANGGTYIFLAIA